MTNQPLDYAALRALAESVIKHSSVIPFGPENIDAADWCNLASPATVLALLDTADRHAALVAAVRQSNWNLAAQLAQQEDNRPAVNE